jgi:hypothetical protein
MFMRELSSRLKLSAPVLVTTGNPGYCRSELNRNIPESLMDKAMKALLARKTEVGSRLIVYASTGERASQEVLRGSYTSPVGGVKEPSDEIISEEGELASKRIWVSVHSEFAALCLKLPQLETIEVLASVDDRIPGILQRYCQPMSIV